jgi:hypothetical protein
MTSTDLTLAAAAHAYEHARTANHPQPHRLDIVEAPPAPRPTRKDAPPATPQPTASPDRLHLTHDIASPTATAFKLGFGLAAGAWTFRAVVIFTTGAAVLLFVLQLLMATPR